MASDAERVNYGCETETPISEPFVSYADGRLEVFLSEPDALIVEAFYPGYIQIAYPTNTAYYSTTMETPPERVRVRVGPIPGEVPPVVIELCPSESDRPWSKCSVTVGR